MKSNKTYIPKPSEFNRQYYLIDAKDKVLGRIAAKAASILRGKHKAIYTPHLDCGDTVIIINAAKVRVTGRKMQDKIYQRYSGYPSGKRTMTLTEMLAKAPTQAMRLAVNRMIPKGPLGFQVRKRLRIYAGEGHPHQGQKPTALVV
jgi:large subunit ribosomal protein L13